MAPENALKTFLDQIKRLHSAKLDNRTEKENIILILFSFETKEFYFILFY